MAPVTTTMLLWLLHTCNHVISVKQEQVGIEQCKRQCARYNKCYGIKYNISTAACRILNNRHTDGETMLLSRKDILQKTSLVHFDIAPPRFQSLRRIVSKKGHAVDVAVHVQSEEITYVRKLFNMSSLRNCKIIGDRFSSPGSSAKAHSCSGITQAFIPGKAYLATVVTCYPGKHGEIVFRLAFVNAQIFHPTNSVDWNITYCYPGSGDSLYAVYRGSDGDLTKIIPNNGTRGFYYFSFLIDRSPAGDVLYDMDYFTQTIRGSIKGPNLNQPVWLAIQVDAPNTHLCPVTDLNGQPLLSARRGLQQWYKKPNI